MNSGLISVIIPVYNVERYLDKCVASIVEQTYQKLEIILVDDGSPDHCPNMCDVWAAKDSRIRVIHKENGGLSRARNAALDICTGEYVVFVDSDDYVDPDYVEYLHKLLIQNNAQMAICAIRYETFAGKPIDAIVDTGEVQLFDQRQAIKIMCDCSLFSNSACAKIFPREFFDTIRFPDGHVYEDLAVSYKLFLKANTVVFGQRSLYHYVRNENSITQSTFSQKRLDEVTYGEAMYEHVMQYLPELKGTLQTRLLAIYCSCWQSALFSRQHNEEIDKLVDELYAKIRHMRKEIWKESMAPRLRAYLLSSLFGKKGMELCFHTEKKLYQLIKLR